MASGLFILQQRKGGNPNALSKAGAAMIVMKFGGTSVEDAQAIERVTEIVRGRLGQNPAVVVSALAGVTDQLLEMGRIAGAGDQQSALELSRALRARHYQVASELLEAGPLTHLHAKLNGYCDLVEELLRRIAAVEDLSPRSTDYLLSFGELLSSEIVNAVFAARGLDSTRVDARECIITDAAHTRAVPHFEETRERLLARVKPLLDAGRVPVLGGFIASTREGVPTTVGRGGSDLSAAIVGAALGAKRIEIWTDVPGMMTTDPALCPEACRIKAISFDEAAESAYFGAKVLHPATLLPAIECNIPVYVLNSRDPDSEGTCIRAHAPRGGSDFRVIAARMGITIVTVAGGRLWTPRGFLRKVFAVFDRHDCPVDIVATSQVSLSLAVDSKQALPAILADLEKLAEVSCENRKAIVCLVGENIRGKPGIAARVFRAVADAGINVRMISQGASELSISFVIEENDAPEAVRRLHAEFFGKRPPRAKATAEVDSGERWVPPDGVGRSGLYGG